MGPKQDHAISRAIQCLNRIARGLSQVKVCQVSEAVAELGGKIIAGWCVVRVAEDTDVGVQSLEGFARVLSAVSS